jgi:hypothetical protein
MPTYNISNNITKALKESGLTSISNPPQITDSLWDCHGNWILKHKACEKIAADKQITFDHPELIESNADKNIAVVLVTGYLGDRTEWSFGEATPKNSKNSYPFAMAEKRAKDRVILKLIGLHGDVYSESEADEFEFKAKKQTKATVNTSVWGDVSKKKVTETQMDLKSLFATISSKGPSSKEGKSAIKEAKSINKWAEEHNIDLIQNLYFSLFGKFI